MHSLRSVCDVFAEASLVSHRGATAEHLSVCWGSNPGRPGLVWPRCSKVWCCYVWIRWLEGQTVSVSYSLPPPTPAFALIGLCLLFGSRVFAEHRCRGGLQHFAQQERSGVKSHGIPAEWGLLCWNNNNNKKKNNAAAAGSHQLMWSLEEAQHVDASHSYDLISFSRCGCRVTHLITCFLNGRVCWNAHHSWRVTRRRRFKRWSHGWQNNCALSSSLSRSRDQCSVSRRWAQTFLGNESRRFICPCLVSKVSIQAKPQIFRWSGQSGTKGTNTMTRTRIMTTISTTWLISTKLVEACSSRGFFLAAPRQQVWSYEEMNDEKCWCCKDLCRCLSGCGTRTYESPGCRSRNNGEFARSLSRSVEW